MSAKPILVVQGGQYGSEAKGNIAARLCIDREVGYAVRTGAINAGHTVIFNGKRFAMQQIPTGWVNPKTKLVIGPGAYIHPETLWREIDMVNNATGADVRHRLFIDYRCGLHDSSHEVKAKAANRHHRMGATGKGGSEAIVAKIRDRGDGYQLFWQSQFGKDFRIRNNMTGCDTVDILNRAYDRGEQILIEGTQGTLLDLHLGPYPFTTSRMTSAANWIAEAGLSPALEYEVVLVVRTFPIRVAGNSGPLPLEIEWVDLAREVNLKLSQAGLPSAVSADSLREFEDKLQEAAEAAVKSERYPVPVGRGRGGYDVRMSEWANSERGVYRVAASELHRDALNLCRPETLTDLQRFFEMTTVTRKLRRIAKLSITDLRFAVRVNRPSWIALTFLDYIEPGINSTIIFAEAIPRAKEFIRKIEEQCGAPVRMVSVGPQLSDVHDPAKLLQRVGEEV